MRILISNDDGYLAPGLVALAAALAPIADITVVAPDSNRSGSSNSLTLDRPLSLYQAANGFYFVNGTPSDCVHLALTGGLSVKPDLVVSGINQGQNMGDDTLYSGTVAAATEGYLFGIPAIAFSQVEHGWQHLDAAAQVAREIVERRFDALQKPFLLNVNVPNKPYADLRRIVAMCPSLSSKCKTRMDATYTGSGRREPPRLPARAPTFTRRSKAGCR